MTDEEFYIIRNNMHEEWKQIIYNGKLLNYDISNTGKVRNHITHFEYKLAKTYGMKNCYEFMRLKIDDVTEKNFGVHRLMALMFVPIPDKYIKKGLTSDKLVVDHIDNVKYHNIVQNLQWLTTSENVSKWYNNIASLNDLCISDKVIHRICKDITNGLTIYEISEKYGVSELLVHDIKFKHRYTYISNKYTFPTKQIDREIATKICELLQDGLSSTKVAKKLGVPQPTVANILQRNCWTDVSENYSFPNARPKNDELVIKICEMLQDGIHPIEIARQLGISNSYVQHINSRETHTDISKNYTFHIGKKKLDDNVVKAICEDIASHKYSSREIGNRHGVSKTFVLDIKNGKQRADISTNYNFT